MKNQNLILKIILWTARIIGSLILAFILFFLLAHVFGEQDAEGGFKNKLEVLMFLFFPISTVIGLGLALKWEGLGGLITILGMFGLIALRPDLIKSFYLMIPIVPGILYILFWLMTKARIKRTT